MTNVACRGDEGVAEHGGANPTAQLLYPLLKVPLVRNDHLFCFIEWFLWWGLLRILVVFIGSHILTCSHVQKMCIRRIFFKKKKTTVSVTPQVKHCEEKHAMPKELSVRWCGTRGTPVRVSNHATMC